MDEYEKIIARLDGLVPRDVKDVTASRAVPVWPLHGIVADLVRLLQQERQAITAPGMSEAFSAAVRKILVEDYRSIVECASGPADDAPGDRAEGPADPAKVERLKQEWADGLAGAPGTEPQCSAALIDALARAGIPCAIVGDEPAMTAACVAMQARGWAWAPSGRGGHLRRNGAGAVVRICRDRESFRGLELGAAWVLDPALAQDAQRVLRRDPGLGFGEGWHRELERVEELREEASQRARALAIARDDAQVDAQRTRERLASLGTQYNAEREQRQDLAAKVAKLRTRVDDLKRERMAASEALDDAEVERVGSAEIGGPSVPLTLAQRVDRLAARLGHVQAGEAHGVEQYRGRIAALEADLAKARADLRRLAALVPSIKIERLPDGERWSFPDGSVCRETRGGGPPESTVMTVRWDVTPDGPSLAREHAEIQRAAWDLRSKVRLSTPEESEADALAMQQRAAEVIGRCNVVLDGKRFGLELTSPFGEEPKP